MCLGPTPIGPQGTHYARCFACNNGRYSTVLDGFVPICYSVNEGLEGAIWRAKNDDLNGWLQLPLASLLWTFLNNHLECIENAYGGKFDIGVTVPSSKERNGVNHLDALLSRIEKWPINWKQGVLVKNRNEPAAERRQRIVTDLFTADQSVNGKRVLLLDDTFTSGGSMASAAYALHEAGATSVVGIAFGRQLNASREEARELISELPQRPLDLDTCPVHDLSDIDLFFMRG
ncbi:ComF family protein [Streptomyces pseudovenezuelae]